MVFTSHLVPFPATGDLPSFVAEICTWLETKPFHFQNNSVDKHILHKCFIMIFFFKLPFKNEWGKHWKKLTKSFTDIFTLSTFGCSPLQRTSSMDAPHFREMEDLISGFFFGRFSCYWKCSKTPDYWVFEHFPWVFLVIFLSFWANLSSFW